MNNNSLTFSSHYHFAPRHSVIFRYYYNLLIEQKNSRFFIYYHEIQLPRQLSRYVRFASTFKSISIQSISDYHDIMHTDTAQNLIRQIIISKNPEYFHFSPVLFLVRFCYYSQLLKIYIYVYKSEQTENREKFNIIFKK